MEPHYIQHRVSTSQSTNQSTNQSINQPISRSIDRISTTNQSANQSINQPLNQSIDQISDRFTSGSSSFTDTECGIPGINLLSLNRTFNWTSPITQSLYFFNPCGQVEGDGLFRAPACLSSRDGPVTGCEINGSDRDIVRVLGTQPTALYVELNQPRGIQITFADSGSACSDSYNQSIDQSNHHSISELHYQSTNQSINQLSSLHNKSHKWSFTAKIECIGDYDMPLLSEVDQLNDCAVEALIKSRASCRCGVPGFDLYELEAIHGPFRFEMLDLYGNLANATFSPCGILLDSPCDTIPNVAAGGARSTFCLDSESGNKTESWMRYTPEGTQWNIDYQHDRQVVVMLMIGYSSFGPLVYSTLITNYWCNERALAPYVRNISLLHANLLTSVTVDIETNGSCLMISSSSTGSSEPKRATETHAIVVIIICVLMLVFIAVLCIRARRHVERWAYVEEYCEQFDADLEDPQLNTEVEPGEVEPGEVEIFPPEYRRMN